MDGEALLEFFLRHNDKLWVLLILLAQRSYRVIESGNRGLRFTFGRAGPVLEPGTHVLIPLVQTVKSLPSRARTLDIPNQTLTTHDGIVLHVDCNLVYQVVDPRRALIEIGDLERGMADLTGIAVQAVLGGLSMADLKQTHALDAELDRRMNTLVEPWGVRIQTARFASIAPSRKSLRITQLREVLGARRDAMEQASETLPPRRALALMGPGRARYSTRTERLRVAEGYRRRAAAWERGLMRAGLTRARTLAAMQAWRRGVRPQLAADRLLRQARDNTRWIRIAVVILVAAFLACAGLLV